MREFNFFSPKNTGNPEKNIQIYSLKEKPEFYETVINWNIEEWGQYWDNPREAADEQYKERLNDVPPLAYIAVTSINGKETPLATFSLVGDVYNFYPPEEKKLFLSRLIVDKNFRSQGIGKKMVQKAEALAEGFGHEACHLFILKSENLDKYYENLGWKVIEDRKWQGENDISIMKKEFPQPEQTHYFNIKKTNN